MARPKQRVESTVEDFLDTWDHHQGSVTKAAERLGWIPNSLAIALRRARKKGIEVRFTDDTTVERTRARRHREYEARGADSYQLHYAKQRSDR